MRVGILREPGQKIYEEVLGLRKLILVKIFTFQFTIFIKKLRWKFVPFIVFFLRQSEWAVSHSLCSPSKPLVATFPLTSDGDSVLLSVSTGPVEYQVNFDLSWFICCRNVLISLLLHFFLFILLVLIISNGLFFHTQCQ